jgi:hypothetical protein
MTKRGQSFNGSTRANIATAEQGLGLMPARAATDAQR